MSLNLTRRGFVLGGASMAAASRLASQSPSCLLVPEQEEGPYYIDFEKLRRNVTEEKPGVPLLLRVALVDSRRCAPLANAALDIWHCDSGGVYSGFTSNGGGDSGPGGRGKGGPPRGGRGPGGGRGKGPGGRSPGGRGATDETRFLRGVQLTSAQGLAEFETIYPGWYQGRTIHIHMKVHLGGATAGDLYAGGHVSHTGQLFFPEEITADVAKLEPYVKHSSVHRTLHSEDGIFRSQSGAQSMVKLERLTRGSNAGGFLATVTLAVDPDATPAAI
jgi:protocatechuate 3,4-dioxygenase beta subunit